MSDPADRASLAAEIADLRAERDSLESRARDAEAMAEQLADELAAARAQLEVQLEDDAHDPHHLTLFDGAPPVGPGAKGLAADGSDRAVLPLALGATAVVAFLVALLSITGGFGFFTFAMLVIASALAWAAWQTRVVEVVVEFDDGVVVVTSEGTAKRFDLRNEHVRIDVQGRPGDADWRVRFYRRALDPVDVDATMVDPADFMGRLRELRPDA